MVGNCDLFHLVKQGETCATISSAYRTSLAQFTTWNPTVGSTCGGIWADAYVCVSIINHSPEPTTTTTTSTTQPPTTTAPGPSPTQSGIIKTCTSYYQAQAGDTCQMIIQEKYPYVNSLTLFVRWNPAVGSSCGNLLAGFYYCVATELHQPMPGIVNNCKRYYQVKAGDTCWSIQQQYGITAEQLDRWNLRWAARAAACDRAILFALVFENDSLDGSGRGMKCGTMLLQECTLLVYTWG
ncbi:hypothetical protein BJX63DRAFT_391096 [Aspergillus granulosus]|uniref:LysM domain-containing protein n=1 Tax=Aspergillus granulosus TaxID=176169 RepID=A0ABR4HJT8_9EURO